LKTLVTIISIVFGALVGAGGRDAIAQAPDGKVIYRQECRTCHGTTGVPTGRALSQYESIPSLADSAFQAGISDDSLLVVLRNGKGEDMKSFKDKLTLEDMRAVIAYMRTLAQAKPE